jgi:hypothetical protein|tara:strand:- start:4765 stop:5328 length:564 start_codon:yes stop_codon:yes gene_type:complete
MPQLTLEHLQKYSKTYAFIESGTYLGDTVKTAIEYGFESVHSIEIEPNLHKDAVEKFKDNTKVKIWKGDSPDIIRENIIPILKSSATFWLDAHRSLGLQTPGSDKYGRCPLLHELDSIAESPIKNHVIIADDVRLFNTIGWDYLKKEDYIEKLMKINPNYVIDYLDGGFSFGRQFPPNDIMVAYVPD